MDEPESTASTRTLRQSGKERTLPEIKAAELITFPHHVLPENNLYAEENIRYDSDAYSLRSTNHLPYLPPNSTGSNRTGVVNWDPVSSLVHEKQYWKERTGYIIKAYGSKYLDTYNALFSDPNQSSLAIPKFMGDFLEIVDQDPDSEFDGVTNWFFSGGRLSHINVDGQNVLLSSCGPKNENLYLIPLENDKEQRWQPVLSASSKLELQESCIHQIVGKSTNIEGLIGIRRKNTCSLYELTPEDGCFQVEGVHSTKSNNIYTSMDISEENRGRYCTSGAGRQVTLWDSIGKQALSSYIIQKPKYSLPIPWSSIHFVRKTFSLLLSDTCSINFLDIRVPYDKPALTFYPRESKHILSPCDDISLAFPSTTSENVIYFATNHHLCQYDPRTVGVVKRWSHMLESPPLYSQTISESTEREWICIASQEPAEVEIIVNGMPGGNDFDNLTFPFMPSTLVETLHESNRNGQFLNPQAQRRLRASITGVTLLPTSKPDSLQLLTQTSLGDVFTQEVTRADTVKEEGADELCTKWENEVVNLYKTPQLYTTDKKDLSQLFTDLQDPERKLAPFNRNVFMYDNIRASKNKLLKYKDKLAPELLAAWKINEQPDWDAKHEESDFDDLDESFESIPQARPAKSRRLAPECSPSLFTLNLSANTPSKENKNRHIEQASQSTPNLLRVLSSARKTPTSAAKRKANVSGF